MKTRRYTAFLLSGITLILLIISSEANAQSAETFRNKAEQGNAIAQHNLAMCYYNGLGVKKNSAEAAKWYRKAAEQGVKESQYALGSLYYLGMGVKKDLTEAVKWYRKAAEQGHVSAQSTLGYCYRTGGEDLPKDIPTAIYWYEKAANQNDPVAQKELGLIYYHGIGIPKDYKKASMWLNKALENPKSDAFDLYTVEETLAMIGDDNTVDELEELINDMQKESLPQEEIYAIVEIMPEFPGGTAALMEYINKNLKAEGEKEIDLIVSFVVTKKGSIEQAKVIRSLTPSFDNEVLRIIHSMPTWKPGIQNRKEVNVRYTMPIKIKK